MPSVPCSPRTPTRRRKSSSTDQSSAARVHINGLGPRRPSHDRTNSQSSVHSARTSWSQAHLDPLGESAISNDDIEDLAGDGEKGVGLGNLADELAEAEDEDDPVDIGGGLNAQEHGVQNEGLDDRPGISLEKLQRNDLALDGQKVSNQTSPPKMGSHNSPRSKRRSRHLRQGSRNGYSDSEDDKNAKSGDGLPKGIHLQMSAIERLARKDVEDGEEHTDELISNLSTLLKELPTQSSVENGSSRLMTSHAAITNHIAHQSRMLHSHTHFLISPLSMSPDLATISDLLPLFEDLSTILPTPSPQCINSLHNLASATADLQATLTYLSDTIYMIRQTSMQASRKLKSAIDLVAEIRREVTAREEGIQWIETGGWNERLARRDCAKVCVEVVGGFEELCRDWRENLAGTASC